MIKSTVLIVLAIWLWWPLSSKASLPDQLHATWFERPAGAIDGVLSTCQQDKCTCGSEVLQHQESSFNTKRSWLPRTIDRLVFLWKEHDKQLGRSVLAEAEFKIEQRDFTEKKVGHPRKIARKKERLERDRKKVTSLACQVLNAAQYVKENYPKVKNELKIQEKKVLNSSEKNKLNYMRTSLQSRIPKLVVAREKYILSSPLALGSYKPSPLRLPRVHPSWLQTPVGATQKVNCTDKECTCGDRKRSRINGKPEEELRRIFLKGFLISHWKLYEKTKRDVERSSQKSNKKRSAKAAKDFVQAECKLLLALHFVNVINKGELERIEKKYQKAHSERQALLAKCKGQPGCGQSYVKNGMRYSPGLSISLKFNKLKKVLDFYSRFSRQDRLRFY